MSDKKDDDEKPKLKVIEDYEHPNNKETEEPLSFQLAKEKKSQQNPNTPLLKTKFDFMSDEDYIILKIEGNGDWVELHYHILVYYDEKNYPALFGYPRCLGVKVVQMKWYDWIFGISNIQQKIDVVATEWMKSIQATIKYNKNIENIKETFAR